MSGASTPQTTTPARFRATLVRVLIVQVVSVVVLGLIQLIYNA